MNIFEAINSGKNFKRPTHNSWFSKLSCIFASDLLADDWVIEEPKIEVNATMIIESYYRYYAKSDKTILHSWNKAKAIEGIIKELGLE